jgi:alkylhydroperoxidase family enzyme
MRDAVLDGPGTLASSARRTAFFGDPVPAEASDFVEKVRLHAYRVTDADIEALKVSGWSEDAIFELTVATALGSALARREIARKAMNG